MNDKNLHVFKPILIVDGPGLDRGGARPDRGRLALVAS